MYIQDVCFVTTILCVLVQFLLPAMEEDDRVDLNRVLIESEFFRQTVNVQFGKALVSKHISDDLTKKCASSILIFKS